MYQTWVDIIYHYSGYTATAYIVIYRATPDAGLEQIQLLGDGRYPSPLAFRITYYTT